MNTQMSASGILIIVLGVLLFVGLVAGIVALCTRKKEKPENTSGSYFDGSTWGYIGYSLLAFFVTAITLGIAYPWMHCMLKRWQAKHTVVCGKRMVFDGKGIQLFGKFFLWLLLTIITLGIYSLWMGVAMKKWETKHTHFQGEPDNSSYFDGGVLGFFGIRFLAGLLTLVTFGIGFAWGQKMIIEWETKHTVIDSRRLLFQGTGGSLFVKYLIWNLLTLITLGIYALLVPVRMLRWQTENTIDHEHTPEALLQRASYVSKVHTDAVTAKTRRMEAEMDVLRSGVNDTMSKETLEEMARQGNAHAAYAYGCRYGTEDENYAGFMQTAAAAGIAGAMYAYAVSGQCADGAVSERFLEGAADRGSLPALHSRFARQQALARQTGRAEDLRNAIYTYDLLVDSGETMSDRESMDYTHCCMALRAIECQLPPSANNGCLIALFVMLGVMVVGGLIAGALLLFNARAEESPRPRPGDFDNMNSIIIGGENGSGSIIVIPGWKDEDGADWTENNWTEDNWDDNNWDDNNWDDNNWDDNNWDDNNWDDNNWPEETVGNEDTYPELTWQRASDLVNPDFSYLYLLSRHNKIDWSAGFDKEAWNTPEYTHYVTVYPAIGITSEAEVEALALDNLSKAFVKEHGVPDEYGHYFENGVLYCYSNPGMGVPMNVLEDYYEESPGVYVLTYYMEFEPDYKMQSRVIYEDGDYKLDGNIS